MTNFRTFFQIIWRCKWIVISICLCCALATIAIGFSKNNKMEYQTRAEIYPTFIFKTTTEPWRLNPCYLTKRSLNSESFQNEVIKFSCSIQPTSLTTDNYSKKIRWHETNRHTIIITITGTDKDLCEETMYFLLDELEVVFWHYTSTVFLERGGYRNIDIAEQENVMDTLPDNYLEIYANEAQQFLIYDLISEPITDAQPFPTAKWTFFITLLALIFTSAIVILINNLKTEK